MNDEIERRLTRLGEAPTPSLDAATVDRLEERLLAHHNAHHRPKWLPVAAAAAIAAVIGVAFAIREGGDNTLRVNPSVESAVDASDPRPNGTDPTTTPAVASSTAGDSAPTPTDTSSAPPVTEPSRSTVTTSATSTESSSNTTADSTRPTTVAPTTTVPSSVPAASFRLRATRIGDRVVFRWPADAGQGAARYVLVRVSRAGLREWPVAEAQIAAIIDDVATTESTMLLPAGETRRFVLAVVGENRQLLAVSTVVEVA